MVSWKSGSASLYLQKRCQMHILMQFKHAVDKIIWLYTLKKKKNWLHPHSQKIRKATDSMMLLSRHEVNSVGPTFALLSTFVYVITTQWFIMTSVFANSLHFSIRYLIIFEAVMFSLKYCAISMLNHFFESVSENFSVTKVILRWSC